MSAACFCISIFSTERKTESNTQQNKTKYEKEKNMARLYVLTRGVCVSLFFLFFFALSIEIHTQLCVGTTNLFFFFSEKSCVVYVRMYRIHNCLVFNVCDERMFSSQHFYFMYCVFMNGAFQIYT